MTVCFSFFTFSPNFRTALISTDLSGTEPMITIRKHLPLPSRISSVMMIFIAKFIKATFRSINCSKLTQGLTIVRRIGWKWFKRSKKIRLKFFYSLRFRWKKIFQLECNHKLRIFPTCPFQRRILKSYLEINSNFKVYHSLAGVPGFARCIKNTGCKF